MMIRHVHCALGVALLLAACGSQPAGNKGSTLAANESGTASVGTTPTLTLAKIAYPGSILNEGAGTFRTGDPPDRVRDWYRDDARRSEGMFVSTEKRPDGTYLVLGTGGEDLKPFTLILSAAAGGGTEGKQLPADWAKKGQKL